MDPAPRFTYVVPLRRWTETPLDELAGYLQCLPPDADVVVVDGSAPQLFAAHARALSGRVRHLAIPPDAVTPNGKVGGVSVGIARARAERIVIADDDVRYQAPQLQAVVDRLTAADVVRPQNYFSPMPWHALWDTSRTLLNRMSGGDWPGTLGVRRSTFLRAGGYSGDVLFENFELVRTLVRNGGREDVALDLYVERRPPEVARFFEQRVRQAYDEFARPVRMALFLAVAPAVAVASARRAWFSLASCAAALVVVAELGRRRRGGTAFFPWQASLLAPLWLAERALCSWIALYQLFRSGGIRYGGSVLRRAAT